MKKDLFEDITEGISDCQYISDLRRIIGKKNIQQIRTVVESLHYDDYSVNQWNELLRYLFDTRETFESSQDAYKKVIECLKK